MALQMTNAVQRFERMQHRVRSRQGRGRVDDPVFLHMIHTTGDNYTEQWRDKPWFQLFLHNLQESRRAKKALLDPDYFSSRPL
jgi:hypothetical protein